MAHTTDIKTNTIVSLRGTLKSLAVGAFGSMFLINAADRDYVVCVAPHAAILNLFWLHTPLERFHVGDTIRVHGTISADNIIVAPVIRNISIQ